MSGSIPYMYQYKGYNYTTANFNAPKLYVLHNNIYTKSGSEWEKMRLTYT